MLMTSGPAAVAPWPPLSDPLPPLAHERRTRVNAAVAAELPEEGRDIHPRSANADGLGPQRLQPGMSASGSEGGSAEPLTAPSPRRLPQLVRAGVVLFGDPQAAGAGAAPSPALWRVRSGLVRLDELASPGAGGTQFVRLAVAGDLIGLEQGYASPWRATTITECVLEAACAEPAQGMAGSRWWLSQMQQRERRCVEALRLRSGEALERLRGFFRLLSEAQRQAHGPDALPQALPMPSLQHLSDVLGIRPESVSRLVSQLKETGGLQRLSRHRVSVDWQGWPA